MAREDWTTTDHAGTSPPCLTFALVELMLARGRTERRTFAWVGMDSAPYFPRLQRYLARLAISQSGEIVHIHVESSALGEAIDLTFDEDRPTIH